MNWEVSVKFMQASCALFVYTEFCGPLQHFRFRCIASPHCADQKRNALPEGARMKPVIYLRIASVLTLLHAILHTIGGVFSTPDPGPQQTAVDAMKANTFPLMGSIRSYFAFFRGMGLSVTI